MNLDQATTLDIAGMTELEAEAAVRCIGAAKLDIRRQMDWRSILVAWEVGLQRRGDLENWRRLEEMNRRLAVLLAKMFKASGHRW